MEQKRLHDTPKIFLAKIFYFKKYQKIDLQKLNWYWIDMKLNNTQLKLLQKKLHSYNYNYN